MVAAGSAEQRLRSAYARRDSLISRERYSIFNRGFLFAVQSRERALLHMLRRSGCSSLEGLKILDVGCGAGAMLRTFNQYGANPKDLCGVDLLADRIERARQLSPGIEFHCGNAACLPFPDASFDLVCQFTLFDTILEAEVRRDVAREMVRVTRRDGAILWYDFHVNNPLNPDARRVTKREIRALFPGCEIRLRRLTLAPPLARLLAPRAWLIASAFETIPLLCTHYLGLITPSGSGVA